MTVTVLFFAGAREAAGTERLDVTLPEPATVGLLRKQLLKQCPGLVRYGSHLWIAVDSAYAGDETSLSPAAEVACFPPVSGG